MQNNCIEKYTKDKSFFSKKLDTLCPIWNIIHNKLNGEYNNFLECHIAPNWILIYQITGEDLILRRTGSHSDLFTKY
jgi:mRNA interferase YafQ